MRGRKIFAQNNPARLKIMRGRNHARQKNFRAEQSCAAEKSCAAEIMRGRKISRRTILH
jgi:hypothetical protein